LKPVTAWFRKRIINSVLQEKFSFNHLEDGHLVGRPVPKLKAQSGWLKEEWQPHHGYIDSECRLHGIEIPKEAQEED